MPIKTKQEACRSRCRRIRRVQQLLYLLCPVQFLRSVVILFRSSWYWFSSPRRTCHSHAWIEHQVRKLRRPIPPSYQQPASRTYVQYRTFSHCMSESRPPYLFMFRLPPALPVAEQDIHASFNAENFVSILRQFCHGIGAN